MTVTGISFWDRRFGYLGSALTCQVTRIALNGVTGYVRENLRNCSGLHVSSSYRLGITGGVINGRVRCGSIPKSATQVLELAAPDAAWRSMADAVRANDHLNRPVIRSPQWTIPKALTLTYALPRRPNPQSPIPNPQ